MSKLFHYDFLFFLPVLRRKEIHSRRMLKSNVTFGVAYREPWLRVRVAKKLFKERRVHREIICKLKGKGRVEGEGTKAKPCKKCYCGFWVGRGTEAASRIGAGLPRLNERLRESVRSQGWDEMAQRSDEREREKRKTRLVSSRFG